ncbi:tautomerase family protein [Pelosinus sp. UFO1]|uniref:tautomerase family protein n=1 Tax=Pelosinus sp. UFO1 TaxID=484770 RepID=UPI0004D14235|nr:tautomerase family protein [Pelosinus sp. UFO1]AIF53079.1 hypothetical protein UFO1_3536 [Pelosinus sp. UFO1]
MPVITIEAAKLSKEQKRELVASLTKSASSIMKTPEQAYVIYCQLHMRPAQACVVLVVAVVQELSWV